LNSGWAERICWEIQSLSLGTLEGLRVRIGGQVLLYRWCYLVQGPPASEQALVLLGVAGGQAIAFQLQNGASVLANVRSQASSSPTVRLYVSCL
jgi:hypothetical protein